MVNRIFKHELMYMGHYVTTILVDMTKHAKVLFVGLQDRKLCLWEQHVVEDESDDPKDKVTRRFITVGTGVEFKPEDDCRLQYIGSVIESTRVFDGSIIGTNVRYVWHVYEQVRY